VKVLKDGADIAVDIDVPVDAPWPVIWDVLTDYDHMAEFVSNISTSGIVARVREDLLRVHQQGSASIGPFTSGWMIGPPTDTGGNDITVRKPPPAVCVRASLATRGTNALPFIAKVP